MDNQISDVNLKKLSRELRATRILCVISSLLTGALLAGGIFCYGQIKPIFQLLEDTRPVVEELAELDISAINEMVRELDMEELSEAVKNLNNTVETLEGFGKKISSFTGLFQ